MEYGVWSFLVLGLAVALRVDPGKARRNSFSGLVELNRCVPGG